MRSRPDLAIDGANTHPDSRELVEVENDLLDRAWEMDGERARREAALLDFSLAVFRHRESAGTVRR